VNLRGMLVTMETVGISVVRCGLMMDRVGLARVELSGGGRAGSDGHVQDGFENAQSCTLRVGRQVRDRNLVRPYCW
jgi:hypothetical protein